MTPTSPDPARDPEALAGAEALHDWCPECDGPGECQPGTCCGRPYTELSEAEVIARGVAALNPWVVSLLAEYDRRGERLKTLELGLLAALMPGLDEATKSQLGRKMRELAGLDENREPI
ncbi:MAG TPA: hypothetical protein VIQ30_24320 [Pseudonocardia sp.]